MSRITESLYRVTGVELTEARNPENDAANTAIRKWANGRGQRSLNKEDKRALEDNGVYFGSMYASGLGEPTVETDDGAMTKAEVKDLHPDYDILGKLNSTRDIDRNKSDEEFPTNSYRGMYRAMDYPMEEPNEHDVSRMSSNQFKTLQPYQIEKSKLKDYKRWEHDAEDRVERAKQELEDQKKKTSAFMDEVRAKRAAKRQNESIELNESKEGLIDYFYQMVSAYDMDYDEQVDYLLCYINESDLAEAISDFKDYMGIDE